MSYVSYENRCDVSKLVGLTLTKIEKRRDSILFETDGAHQFLMFHDQACCENVTVDDITGDLDDLIGSPILIAEEVTSKKNPDGITKEYQDSFTWTFYKLATAKGSVTIRWYGESNGYYSETVDFGLFTGGRG
jgi:hypothetical protein